MKITKQQIMKMIDEELKNTLPRHTKEKFTTQQLKIMIQEELEEGFLDRLKSRASAIGTKTGKSYAGFDYVVKIKRKAAKKLSNLAQEIETDLQKLGDAVDSTDAKQGALIVKTIRNMATQLAQVKSANSDDDLMEIVNYDPDNPMEYALVQLRDAMTPVAQVEKMYQAAMSKIYQDR
tara:strand:- start:2907 stop:3440 length:534 start_codon:yes stop_codon:yes gene_type:complete